MKAVVKIFRNFLNCERDLVWYGARRGRRGMNVQGIDSYSGSHSILNDTSREENPKCHFTSLSFTAKTGAKFPGPGATSESPESTRSLPCPPLSSPLCSAGLWTSYKAAVTVTWLTNLEPTECFIDLKLTPVSRPTWKVTMFMTVS